MKIYTASPSSRKQKKNVGLVSNYSDEAVMEVHAEQSGWNSVVVLHRFLNSPPHRMLELRACPVIVIQAQCAHTARDKRQQNSGTEGNEDGSHCSKCWNFAFLLFGGGGGELIRGPKCLMLGCKSRGSEDGFFIVKRGAERATGVVTRSGIWWRG